MNLQTKNKNKYKKIKNCLGTITLFVFIFQFMIVGVYANSSSTTYSLSEEGLNFGHTDTSLSSNYNLSGSSIYWTERGVESSSYMIADSNSIIESVVPPTLPPPTTPPAGGGSASGGNSGINFGSTDYPIITVIPMYPYLDVPVEPPSEDEEVPREVAQVEEEAAEGIEIPVTFEDVSDDFVQEDDELHEITEEYDDNDACSYEYERLYLGTDPYKDDTDGDGIDDCDEALIFGLDPLIYNTINDNVEVTQEVPYSYSSQAPFIVGRVDQDTELDQKDEGNFYIRLIDEKNDQYIDFSLMLMDDQNFAYLIPYELENGFYKINLMKEDEVLHENSIFIDNGEEDMLFDVVADEDAVFYGQTESNIRVNAIWYSNELVDVATTVSDAQGKFSLEPPQEFDAGEFNVIIFAINDKLEQSLYINYEISIAQKGHYLRIDKKDLSYEKIDWTGKGIKGLKQSAKDSPPNYLKNIAYFLIIVIVISLGLLLYIRKIRLKE